MLAEVIQFMYSEDIETKKKTGFKMNETLIRLYRA